MPWPWSSKPLPPTPEPVRPRVIPVLRPVTPIVPNILFQDIIGLEEEKEILNRSLASLKPVHVLLHGPPASAKTLFLEDLAKLPGAEYVLGSNLSKVGLFDVLFDQRPRLLILDELDKVVSRDLACLLSLMEGTLITETKHRKRRVMRLDRCWVYASANEVKKMRPELLSRFLKLPFHAYMRNDFIEIGTQLLVRREGLPEQVALHLADRMWSDGSRDVRDVLKVRRLMRAETVEEAEAVLTLLRRQSQSEQ